MALINPISQLAMLLKPQQPERGEVGERPRVGGGDIRMLASILSGGLAMPMTIGRLVGRNERGERFDRGDNGFRDIGGGLRGRERTGPRGERGFQVE